MKKFTLCLLVLLVVSFISSAAFASAPTKENAIALVKKAATYLKANGKEKTLAEISNPKGQFVAGELYLFAQDFNGLMLAHGSNQKLIGKNLANMKDPDGKFFGQEMIKAAKQGSGWVDYKWSNPVSKQLESKTTYVFAVGDMFFGCGIYK